MKEYPIRTSSGNPYVTVEDVNDDIFHLRLDTCYALKVVLDKKAIPDIIKALNLIKGESNASQT